LAKIISSVINLPNVKSELLACGSIKHVSTYRERERERERGEKSSQTPQNRCRPLLPPYCYLVSTEEAHESVSSVDCRNDNKLDS